MKNKIITICVIMAALLSFMSFAAVLTQMNSNDDVIEEKAPELKKATFGRFDSSEYSKHFVIFYYDGMTWEDWYNSEFNITDLELDSDGYFSLYGYRIYALPDLTYENGGYEGPVEDFGLVKKSDLITHNFYGFNPYA